MVIICLLWVEPDNQMSTIGLLSVKMSTLQSRFSENQVKIAVATANNSSTLVCYHASFRAI